MSRLTSYGDVEVFENNASSPIRMLGAIAALLFAMLLGLIFIG
ncbi:hypothetical protein MMIC_P1855 [Mariprofundus micogutta]|uniref:Uncharacterized protein n=1 Tax=Mariprofundus micogutta TaxID=1921010 RepID=A0A1L8CPN1_9PROT|nr:hypothetical protein [Mariprofundus micogutta]GAV20880.1 hypothetical protein MMIC_P1855 [Mariprofundus micogutta]